MLPVAVTGNAGEFNEKKNRTSETQSQLQVQRNGGVGEKIAYKVKWQVLIEDLCSIRKQED